MIYEGERKVELAAEMTMLLFELNSKVAKSPMPTKSNDLRFYGAIIYCLCAAVLVCLSNTSLVWSLLAPCSLGVIIGIGLVVADQFSLRSRLIQITKFFSS